MKESAGWIRPLLGKPFLAATILVLGYLIGIGIHLIALPFALSVTSWTLWMMGGIAVVFSRAPGGASARSFWIWLGIAAVVTLIIEMAGVATGFPFGKYAYGGSLGFKILNVPVVIGWNWALAVAGASVIAFGLVKRTLFAALLTGLFCAVYDFILEPLAYSSRMDYWHWEAGLPGWENYLAWFVIATLGALSLKLFRIELPGKLLGAYFLIQLAFFGILRLVMGI